MPTKPRGEGEPPITTTETKQPLTTRTDTATPPIDREFRNATDSFMKGVEVRLHSPNSRFDGKSELDDMRPEDRQVFEDLLVQAKKELFLLAKNDDKPKNQADYALGVSMIARDLSDSSHFFRYQSATADKETVDKMRLAFAEGKKLLLATAEKLWPDLKVKPEKIKPFDKLDTALSAVENFADPGELSDLREYGVAGLLKAGEAETFANPKRVTAATFLYTLDRIIEDVGNYVGNEAQSTHNFSMENGGNLMAAEKTARRETISSALRGLSELIQIRDLIDVEHNGGGYAHPPREVEQIAEARAQAERVANGPSGSTGKVGSAERQTQRTTETGTGLFKDFTAEDLFDTLDQWGKRQARESEEAETRNPKAVSVRNNGFLLEGLRNAYPTDAAAAIRLENLVRSAIGRIDSSAVRGNRSRLEDAISDAARETIKLLTPDERTSIQQAGQKEFDRQMRRGPRMGMNPADDTTIKRLLADLIKNFIR